MQGECAGWGLAEMSCSRCADGLRVRNASKWHELTRQKHWTIMMTNGRN